MTYASPKFQFGEAFYLLLANNHWEFSFKEILPAIQELLGQKKVYTDIVYTDMVVRISGKLKAVFKS